MEENFRNALAISNGHLDVFVTRPMSAIFLGACAVLILVQLYAYLAMTRRRSAWLGIVPDLPGAPEIEE
jgi:TctA family transporter